MVEQLVSKTDLLSWLLNRVQSKAHDDNRGYAAELLSILLQSSRSNRLELSRKDGIEGLLKVASVRLHHLETPVSAQVFNTAISTS